MGPPNTTCFARHARGGLTGAQPEILSLIEPSLAVIDSMTLQIRNLESVP